MKNLKCKMRVSPFAGLKVDIIIPFHGLYDQVGRLLESILRGTYTNQYQIILVDDASPNKNFLIETEVPYLKKVRLNQRVGFGGALKAGFQVSSSPYVCFLNSDCLIQHPTWLSAMGESLLNGKAKNIRLVSARSNNPVCDISQLKGERGSVIEDTIVDSPLPLYCALCHRELFNRIGGFIKEYPYGYYEDAELFYRMEKYGFKQGISGKSWVYHEGAATIQASWKQDPEVKQVMLEQNRLKCIEDVRIV